MRMHPKPALRHTRAVEPFNVEVIYQPANEHQPFHILFTRQTDGATQRLTLTEPEARKIALNLVAALRYRDTPITDVPTDDMVKLYDNFQTLSEKR